MDTLTFEQFLAVDMRVGTIISAKVFERAKKPAYQLSVDLGDLGIKNSSAQVTALYTPENLVGRQVVCVTNLAPRNIAGFMSEVLVMGIYNERDQVILITPEQSAPNGARLC